jgi:hypothetical protein
MPENAPPRECSEYSARLNAQGFAILPGIVGNAQIAELLMATREYETRTAIRERAGAVYAARNLLDVPRVAALANSTLLDLATSLIGGRPFPVRGIYFDKSPGANWGVVWHQDTSIAVQERLDVPGFGPWSVKADVHHVRPPAAVLEGMVTLRLHLDGCDESNGPLEVIPGSHRLGVIPEQEIATHRETVPKVQCHVPAGGVVAMKPLILHASAPAAKPSHRRVIHIEYASAPLPGGLSWHSALNSAATAPTP